MYHVVLIGLTLTVLYLGWQLVHCMPPAVARFLPPGITRIVGYFMLFFGTFCAAFESYYGEGGRGLISCFMVMAIGLWFLLAPSAGLSGTYRYEQMLKRVFFMLGFMFAALIGSMYVGQSQLIAVLNLTLITAGFWMTTNFLHQIDSGRW